MAPASPSVESSLQEKWNSGRVGWLSGGEWLSLFLNLTGALGCRGGLGGKPGGSDRGSGSPQEDLCGESLVCLAPRAGVPPTQAVSGRTGGPGSTSRVLGLGTMTS